MKTLQEICEAMLTEAVSCKDFERAKDLMSSYFSKRKIYFKKGVSETIVDGQKYYSTFAFNTGANRAASVCWKMNGSGYDVDTITFYKNAELAIYSYFWNEPIVCDAVITNEGMSLAKLLPLIADVLTGKTDVKPKAIEDALYSANESLTDSITESALDVKKEKDKVRRQLRKAELAGDEAAVRELTQRFNSLKNEFEAAKATVSGPARVSVSEEQDLSMFEEKIRPTPEQRFKDMLYYVNMVLKGMRPSAVICGAPGVGKTFRITKLIQSRGYKMFDNYMVMKGKCTPAALYQTLFEYSNENDLLLVDDADSVVQDDDAINLLKAALDSSDHRYISYATSKAPLASEAVVEMKPDLPWDQDSKGRWCYPKNFEYKGRMIIITNLQAGMFDTALRNRSILCDLEFTPQESLEIVESLIDVLGGPHLGMAAKKDSLKYLKHMLEANMPVEISCRSFIIVAELYEATEGDTDSAERMIREQMKLAAARGGKRH